MLGALFAIGEWAAKAETLNERFRVEPPSAKEIPSEAPNSRISDNPWFKERALAAATGRFMARWVLRVAPVVRLFGINTSSIAQSARDMSLIAPQLEAQLGLPDRFNALYSKRGWIAYGTQNQEAMLHAIALGEAGELTAGEQVLVDSYTHQFVDFALFRMGSLEHFSERRSLARLSMADFFDGRFHACVPNILMLIDGLASDVMRTSPIGSFFSERVDLTAWDSVEGHSTGLPVLGRLMRTPRTERSTELIEIPFRHGILHGIDLGFASKLIAAKCWGALFALGEWARKVEQGQRTEPSPPPKRSLRHSLRELVSMAQRRKRLEEWRPRDLTIGATLARSGPSTLCEIGTPEQLVLRFLELWVQRNYGTMAQLLVAGNRSESALRSETNVRFRTHRLHKFELLSIEQRGPSSTNFEVKCSTEFGTAVISILALLEHPNGELFHSDWTIGNWKIYNWWAFLAHLPDGGP